jgi:uncharacterized repeat protein (TIGR03809 family)
MTDRTDVARGRDIVARWCGLAEQRLEYLTELYDSGRWRRYHSERDFLDNIREARAAVETWRSMLGEDAAGTPAVDLSWLGRRSTLPPMQRAVRREQAPSIAPQVVVDFPVAPRMNDVPEFAEAEAPVLEAAALAEESNLDKTLALTLDIVTMQERYPLLRNAL